MGDFTNYRQTVAVHVSHAFISLLLDVFYLHMSFYNLLSILHISSVICCLSVSSYLLYSCYGLGETAGLLTVFMCRTIGCIKLCSLLFDLAHY